MKIQLLLITFIIGIGERSQYTCPSGTHGNGIRNDGYFTCLPDPIPGVDIRTPRGGWTDTSVMPDGELSGTLHCTGGSRPIVVDYRSVGCQR